MAYSDYKDSGVEWLGDIPSHWKLTRIKYITKCLDGNRIPLNTQERGDMRGEIPYWGANKIVDHVNNFLFDEELVLLGEDGAPFFDATKDVAFNVSGKIWPNNHVHILRPEKSKVESRFLKYAINCADFYLYISGSTRDKLNQSDMNEIYIRSCQLLEQAQIANFLDYETAKIDTLIEKQRQLIKLLKEKRQAVISHAVTKGLNPDAPMKDSGVEWLGEVPEHWEVLCIKHIVLIPITDGPHETPVFLDSGVPFVSAEAVSSGKIDFNKIRGYISEEDNEKYSKKYSPQMHDIFMVKSGATTGVTAIVETNNIFNIWSPLAVIRCKNDSAPYFVLNFLRSLNFQEAVELNWSFGTQQNIGMGVIENIHITRPSLEEATLITKELTKKNSIFDGIIEKATEQVALLQERRTALISAAVTGKIDVRNWKTSEQNKNNKEDAL